MGLGYIIRNNCQQTCDRFRARGTFSGEQFSEALNTVRFVIPRSEFLLHDILGAVSTTETLSVERLTSVQHSAR